MAEDAPVGEAYSLKTVVCANGRRSSYGMPSPGVAAASGGWTVNSDSGFGATQYAPGRNFWLRIITPGDTSVRQWPPPHGMSPV